MSVKNRLSIPFFNSKAWILLPALFHAIILIGSFSIIDFLTYGDQVEKIALKNAHSKLRERNNLLNSYTNRAGELLFAIRQSDFFGHFLENPSQTGVIKSMFHDIMLANPAIMQVRFIDASGMEKIRFDRASEASEMYEVPDNLLQDKSNRDYFQETRGKQMQMWFSKLDLNQERGAIEVPFKPTYRVVHTVWKDDAFRGILIINFFARELLQRLLDAPLYDGILVDSKGCIMAHYDSQKSWSCQQKVPFRLDAHYEESLQSAFLEGDGFVSKKLETPLQNDMTLILQLKKSYLNVQQERYLDRLLVVACAVFGISVIVSFIFMRIMEFYKVRLEKKQEEIETLTQKQNEQEILLMRQSKMASMGEMLGVITHQWKQPLSSVSLIADNLNELDNYGELTHELLQKNTASIKYQVKFMDQTINDFRSFFKPTKEKVCFDPRESIIQVSKMFRDHFQKEMIEIYIEEGKPFDVLGYPNELMQVALNILNNAKDVLVEKKVATPKISCYFAHDRTTGVIRIRDNGGGIPKELLPHKLFESYVSTKGEKGTGIGLQISKIIIEQNMNGRLWVHNVREGAEFVIEIPLPECCLPTI